MKQLELSKKVVNNKMQVISDNKSHKIQALRGLSIIAVVFIHNTPAGTAQIWCRPFFNFSVGMFLFLSGMLSCAKNWNPLKRIMKICIPYFIWTLIYVLLKNYNSLSQISIVYIKNLITGRSAAVMYYVFVYCELTLLIPMIDKLARSKYKWIGFLITPIEIIVMRLIPLILGNDMNEYVSLLMDLSCLGWFTYYYLGYLLGNGIIKIKSSTSKIVLLWICSIVLQILEGYWYYSMGDLNCGTQNKLTAILSGVLFILLAYKYIETENTLAPKTLRFLGGYSFGIFFSHLAVMSVLNLIPFYRNIIIYPFNAIITITITLICAVIGKKLLGRIAKYFAL